MSQSPMNALVVANAIGQLKAIDIDGETMQFILDEVGMTDQIGSQLNATKPKRLTDQEVKHLDLLNNFIEYWSSDDAMRERMYAVAHDFVTEVMRDIEGDAKQPTWFEVFETDADGSTRTIASFDTKQEALAFVLSQPKGLDLDEWTRGENGIPQIVYNQI